jgi:hypothetical protein
MLGPPMDGLYLLGPLRQRMRMRGRTVMGASVLPRFLPGKREIRPLGPSIGLGGTDGIRLGIDVLDCDG